MPLLPSPSPNLAGTPVLPRARNATRVLFHEPSSPLERDHPDKRWPTSSSSRHRACITCIPQAVHEAPFPTCSSDEMPMYHHVKKLMYVVRVDEPSPVFGNMLLE